MGYKNNKSRHRRRSICKNLRSPKLKFFIAHIPKGSSWRWRIRPTDLEGRVAHAMAGYFDGHR